MDQVRERLGFIGLGTMGAAVATHLVRAGFPLTVYARRPEAAAPLAALGAVAVDTPAAVAARSDIVFTMVTGTADVEQVVLGPGGLAEGLKPGGLIIDMTTIAPSAPPRLAARLAERGIGLLDAPVSGGPEGARQGQLTVMVGGADADLARAMPAFEAFSARVIHMGRSGAGQTTKACHQLLLLITAEGVAESLALASRAGVDPARVREVMLNAMASSRVLDRFGGQMAAGDFSPGIPARLYQKDIGIVRDFAAEVGASLPAGDVVGGRIAQVVEAGRGDDDLSVIITTLT